MRFFDFHSVLTQRKEIIIALLIASGGCIILYWIIVEIEKLIRHVKESNKVRGIGDPRD